MPTRANPTRPHPTRASQSRACLSLTQRYRVKDKQADGGNAPPTLGHRTRRKRLFTACVATFLTPLMAVDPATLQAGITEAIQTQVALSAGVPLSCPVDTVCTTYAYDANGNQVSRTRTNAQGTATDTYTFDYQNRLAGAITNIDTAPTHVVYEYDADGIRVAKTVRVGKGVRNQIQGSGMNDKRVNDKRDRFDFLRRKRKHIALISPPTRSAAQYPSIRAHQRPFAVQSLPTNPHLRVLSTLRGSTPSPMDTTFPPSTCDLRLSDPATQPQPPPRI